MIDAQNNAGDGQPDRPDRIQFADFEFDPRALELRKHGVRIKVQGQPLEILALLLERPGEFVSREDLQHKLWPAHTFVDFEQSLNAAIKRLRVALNDSADQPQYIETLARRGYRFIGTLKAPQAVPIPIEPLPIHRTRRRVAVLVAAGILLLAGGYTGWQLRQGRIGSSQRVMLVVLPFENLSGDPQQEYFSDGFTEEMITQLGSLHPEGLGVIARSSAMQYRNNRGDVLRIADELGVDYILEGSVRREGSLVRISVRLIQARDQTNVWAQSYERSLPGILTLQQELAGAIGREIQLKLTPDQQVRLAAARSMNPEAHEAYLKGLYFWNKFTVEGFYKSIEYFEQAIALDPQYASAYAALAVSCINLVEFSQPPAEFYAKGDTAARKALEIDPSSSQAHATLALYFLYSHHDWDSAAREFLSALELNPSNTYARMHYARYLSAMGRHSEAQVQIERARREDPVSLAINVVKAHVLFYARQYDAALAHLAKMHEMDPDFPPTHWTLAHVYGALGRDDEACQAMLKTFYLGSGRVPWFAQLDEVRKRSGWRSAWQMWIDGLLQEEGRGQYVQPYPLVEAYLNLRQDQEVIVWLRRAAELRDNEIIFINVDPRFDRLRANPSFQEIVRSLKFPPDPVRTQ